MSLDASRPPQYLPHKVASLLGLFSSSGSDSFGCFHWPRSFSQTNNNNQKLLKKKERKKERKKISALETSRISFVGLVCSGWFDLHLIYIYIYKTGRLRVGDGLQLLWHWQHCGTRWSLERQFPCRPYTDDVIDLWNLSACLVFCFCHHHVIKSSHSFPSHVTSEAGTVSVPVSVPVAVPVSVPVAR